LRARESLELSRIFSDPMIASAWNEDHACISGQFGDGEYSGGVNPGDRRALYFLMTALRPRSVLEVGTHIGASTIYIAAALKRLNEDAKLTTIDIVDVNHPAEGAWKKAGVSKSPADLAAALALQDRICFRTSPALKFMTLTEQRFETVYEELAAALPLLDKAGLILLHDYYSNAAVHYGDSARILGPFHALRRAHKENPEIRVLPLGELPWPTKPGTKMTSLALVAKG
jgi:predicted O-methyltransferase YrrM